MTPNLWRSVTLCLGGCRLAELKNTYGHLYLPSQCKQDAPNKIHQRTFSLVTRNRLRGATRFSFRGVTKFPASNPPILQEMRIKVKLFA
jgi:hypothetical protein